MVAGGVSPEVAYMECVGALKLLAELVEARGLAGMREAISNTAELGATLGGPHIVDDGLRARMTEILGAIRSGSFAEQLAQEYAGDYPKLREARQLARTLMVEQAAAAIAALGDSKA